MITGIGIDIVEIDRIKTAVNKFGDKFLNKIFVKNEIDYCTKFNKLRYPELSVRFAAKEAYAKAIGTGMVGIYFKQIEIFNDKKGKPYFKINGKFDKRVHLSLSHSQKYAVASVVVESNSRRGNS